MTSANLPPALPYIVYFILIYFLFDIQCSIDYTQLTSIKTRNDNNFTRMKNTRRQYKYTIEQKIQFKYISEQIMQSKYKINSRRFH